MKTTLIITGMAAAAALLLLKSGGSTDQQDEGIMDAAQTTLDQAFGAMAGTGPIDDMKTSPNMLDMLKRRESLSLSRYDLGDGGYTWGYGHYSKSPDALPRVITREKAESIFADDVTSRGEKWVKLYVTVPLTQYQFDALVSIAFNMSPQSFKKFADSVNSGQGIDDIAQASVGWVKDIFINGIQNRRDAELSVFNNGVYA
jgi:lysozyme